MNAWSGDSTYPVPYKAATRQGDPGQGEISATECSIDSFCVQTLPTCRCRRWSSKSKTGAQQWRTLLRPKRATRTCPPRCSFAACTAKPVSRGVIRSLPISKSRLRKIPSNGLSVTVSSAEGNSIPLNVQVSCRCEVKMPGDGSGEWRADGNSQYTPRHCG